MVEEMATVKIFKFDPSVDNKPKYVYYQVPQNDWTVLDVLNYIYRHYDPNLSFRSGCQVGTCGCCPISVNARPVLSCQKRAEKDMIIEPHPGFNVVKDLVVDLDLPKGNKNNILPHFPLHSSAS